MFVLNSAMCIFYYKVSHVYSKNYSKHPVCDK